MSKPRQPHGHCDADDPVQRTPSRLVIGWLRFRPRFRRSNSKSSFLDEPVG